MQKISKASFKVALDEEIPTDNSSARLYLPGPRIFLSDKTILSIGNKLFVIKSFNCIGKFLSLITSIFFESFK
jgi:hypothetical protein